MMVPFSSIVSNQIRFLLDSLEDSNFHSVRRELFQFVEYGADGSILLLETCLDRAYSSGDINNMRLKPDILASVFQFLLVRPNFSTVLCEALRGRAITEGFLEEICNFLQFSLSEKISIGLAVADSENLDIRTIGQNFCMSQIQKLSGNLACSNSREQIQNIILFLYRHDSLAKHVDSFMQMLSLMDPKDINSCILAPVLSDDIRDTKLSRNMDFFYDRKDDEFDAILAEIEKETSMADIMRELGYGCTFDASHCKELLSLFLPLSEETLSRILGTIARTCNGLEDSQNLYSTFCSAVGSGTISDSSFLSSWNIDVLLDSIMQLAPATNWIRVMENLDHEGFYIPNQEAFSFLMFTYGRACQDPFPLHAICGSVWKNVDGQISFLRYAVTASPELFTFAPSVRQLGYTQALSEHELAHGQSNRAWTSLDLLKVLCQLAERGHAGSVRPLLDFPLKQCPETLLLGTSQINTTYNLLQYEVASTVFPLVVNATKSTIVHQLWLSNSELVLREFVDMMRADQGSMFRILDICQEIKILPYLLEEIPFHFSIRLAVLASKKEFIHLEKWVDDTLNTYKDVFFEECLKFVKEISSDATDDVSANPFPHSSTARNIYTDSSSTILKVLELNVDLVASAHLSEELKKMHGASPQVSPRMQTNGGSDSQSRDGYADDIEAEANSYFHKIFSEQLSIDSMIRMLAQFKESSEKREQSIYGCMIQNLFEEYRFFPRYPEKQLKIAALLLGSLIKNQLVTHLTLGIALRGVLDALRKPTDSKIFAFGTQALEQFLDRLVEWPQYCNHILQISHLRITHPELVAFIERALARISAGHSDISGNNGSTDANANSGPATVENVEMLETSWQLSGSRTMHPGQQISSTAPLQQRHQGFLGERLKPPIPASGYSKQLLPPSGHSLNALTGDLASNQKSTASQSSQIGSSQTSASVAAATNSSSSFLNSSRAGMLRQPSYNTGFGSALNIETLVAAAERRDTPIEVPASDIQDKILFMINNISSSNVEAKAKEFSEVLDEQYYPWFAQYMVMKRASIEPNFHDLYLKFLDRVNSKALNGEIVKAAYENCKVLLRSELIKSSSEERSLLKNLGSWLGKFTIGKNKVLLAREIDPKSLIIEAYEKGLMIAVIPFTSKVLEPCQSSLAYQPPNPWTMAILGLLVEIYALPNLKMNLKFDIEVLFKNLGVDMKEVKPTSLLKDRVREVEGNPDFSNKDIGVSQPQIVPDLQSDIVSSSHPGGHMNVLPQYPASLHLNSSQLAEDEKIPTLCLPERLPSAQGLSQVAPSQPSYSVSQLPAQIPNIASQIHLNQKLNALGLHFQRVVPIAIERAVKEVMTPVVQRSVAIAIQTTKELVLKDYAMESDESRIYTAAHLMVSSLAGSLAHVTCKEPLRTSISNQLRSSFQSINVANDLLEQAIPLVMNDNLDFCCATIEQAATEKATQTIDGEIAQQLALRRKHREGVGPAYYDASMYTQGAMGVIPEALRPRPGHLSTSQQRVYEDFIQFPWQNQPGKSSSVMPPGSVNSGVSRGYAPGGQSNSSFFPSGIGAAGLNVSQPLDISCEELDSNSAKLLSSSARVDGVNGAKVVSVGSLSSTSVLPEMHSAEDSAVEMGGTSASLPISSGSEHIAGAIGEPLNVSNMMEKYYNIAQKLEAMISKEAGEAEIQGVISEILDVIRKCVSRDEAALTVAQKVFNCLYDNPSNNLHLGTHLATLAGIRDVNKLVVKELTSWVLYSEDERKFNAEVIVGLIHKDLLNLTEYNTHMAKLIDAGRNKAATEFSITLMQTLLQESRDSTSELQGIIDVLTQLAARPSSPESLQQLVEIARNPSANPAGLSSLTVGNNERSAQAREKKASDRFIASREDQSSLDFIEPAFRDQASLLFAEWYQTYEHHSTNDAACTHYIAQLQQAGLLNADDTTDKFFRLLTELSVAHCLNSDGAGSGSFPSQSTHTTQNLSFLTIDVYAKLVVLVLRYCVMEHGPSKLHLFPKILSVTVKVIQKDADEKRASFNPRPYFRLFINWFYDLVSSDSILDAVSFQVSVALANAFHALQPLKLPAFSFAWLELISHRSFMPKLLMLNGTKGWGCVQRLLVDLFKFMEPYLRNAELADPIQFLYKGTLRVLLVLLHDFPEFLCDYHFSFCDVIPSSCIQMRNVILSAFPRNMRLPDPSTPNLKIDLLAEINQSPHILSDVESALKAKQMKSDIDECLKTKHQGFLSELKPRLMLPQSEAAHAGTRYNVPLMNSLVLYVGIQSIQQLQAINPSLAQQMAHNGPTEMYSMGAALDIFQTLIVDLDTEGRYLFLNAIANQLRYPNNHTHFFSFVLLYLFVEANQEIIQEQITRVLLERLIVNKPHPWGLLITFIELIKNNRYNFWSRSFTRCAPEIEKLFESVSRSCGGPKPVDESMLSGGMSDNLH